MTAEELSEATDSTKASCKGSLRLAYQKGLIERRYCVAVDVVAGTYEYYVEEGK